MTPDRVAHKGIDLRFVEANAVQRAMGLLGWVYGTYRDVQLDGLRVSRADSGRYVAEFSTTGGDATGGGRKPGEIEDLVLAELRRMGVLR